MATRILAALVLLLLTRYLAFGDEGKQAEAWKKVYGLMPEMKDKSTYLGKQADQILADLKGRKDPLLESDDLPFAVALKAQQALIHKLVIANADALTKDQVQERQLQREKTGAEGAVVERQAQELINAGAQQRQHDLQQQIQLQQNLQNTDRLKDSLLRRP